MSLSRVGHRDTSTPAKITDKHAENWIDEVEWARPEYDTQAVNRAGRLLALNSEGDGQDNWLDYNSALLVANNWRASHAYPLNTFQMYLRNVVKRYQSRPLVAQRVKRLASIEGKLQRFSTMRLSQMQDLGGCRAILPDVRTVFKVLKYYLEQSEIKHELVKLNDYVSEPKESGYRGLHLVYSYFSDKGKVAYNGLKIEVQLRSREQHAWATAVETVGMFSGQALKSSMGSDEWQRFFALMGSAIANSENSPPVPGTPEVHQEVVAKVKDYAQRLQVTRRLSEYGRALRLLNSAENDAHYYLLELNPEKGELIVRGFQANQTQQAEQEYAAAEKRAKQFRGRDAVLVSVDSIRALRKAYPNYFADTRAFAELVEKTITPSRGVTVRERSVQRLPT